MGHLAIKHAKRNEKRRQIEAALLKNWCNQLGVGMACNIVEELNHLFNRITC